MESEKNITLVMLFKIVAMGGWSAYSASVNGHSGPFNCLSCAPMQQCILQAEVTSPTSIVGTPAEMMDGLAWQNNFEFMKYEKC